MIDKTIPHTSLYAPDLSPTKRLPSGALFKFLVSINELGRATVPQLADWLGLNVDYARQMLMLLKPKKDGTGGFISVLPVTSRKYQRRGSVPPVYTLNARGREYMRLQGLSVPRRFKASERVCKPHTLAVNQVLTLARVLERQNPWVKLAAFRHEQYLIERPMWIPLTKTQTVGLSPDLWLDFRGTTSGRFTFCVEVNLTEVTEKVWRNKIRAYLHCLPVYKRMFGTAVLQVVVICATRENFPKRETPFETRSEALQIRGPQAKERWQRVQNLKAWTEKELTHQNATEDADMFLFTDFALDRATAKQLFVNQNFLRPNSTYSYPLLKRKGGQTHA